MPCAVFYRRGTFFTDLISGLCASLHFYLGKIFNSLNSSPFISQLSLLSRIKRFSTISLSLSFFSSSDVLHDSFARAELFPLILPAGKWTVMQLLQWSGDTFILSLFCQREQEELSCRCLGSEHSRLKEESSFSKWCQWSSLILLGWPRLGLCAISSVSTGALGWELGVGTLTV